ncbi:hypothetical protein KP79_PYT04599 [Mizuhopecten yessoensis]|uniref:WSC domain-containing protein n=1 Tax=Mizuhopecten yessoensis TaxID=6573 RepID=A0A210QX76_MIZYE|nr:hypothetical protein KP79_PYT04599 [Mizuhopecten yessoensis]
MFCRNLICIVLLVSSTNCTYQYIRTPATLRNAYSFCRKNDGSLANYGDDLKREIQNWNPSENTTIWTGNFQILSPWISLVGCYRYGPQPDPNRTLVFLVNTSAAACGIYCSKYTNKYFALQGKRCLCVAHSDVLLRTGDNACDLACDGSPLSEPCGSTERQNWILYSKVTFSQDTTNTSDHCIAGMCNRNGGYTLYGSNCSSSYKGVCSSGNQLEHESDWTSSLHTCISTNRVHLVTNMTGLCRNMHHYAWRKFWIGQFRGVAQHIGPDIPDSHIVGCTLVTIETNSRNKTSRTFHSEGCETELRSYICKLNNDGMERSSTFGMERTTSTYDSSTSTPHTLLNSNNINSIYSTGDVETSLNLIVLTCYVFVYPFHAKRPSKQSVICQQIIARNLHSHLYQIKIRRSAEKSLMMKLQRNPIKMG